MSEIELNELKPSFENPVELVCDDEYYICDCKKISIVTPMIKDVFFGFDDSGDAVAITDLTSLNHYPSLLKERPTETLYECIGLKGHLVMLSLQGCEADYVAKEFRSLPLINESKVINRKTGRTCKIFTDTFEIVEGSFKNEA